jgi:hypothetical protein
MANLVALDIPGAKSQVQIRPMGWLRGARLFQDGKRAPWHRWGKSWLVELEDGGQVEVRYLPISLIYTLPCLEIAGRRVELGERIPTGLVVLALLPLLMVPVGGALGGALGGIGAAFNLHLARGNRGAGIKAALMLAVLVAAGALAVATITGIQLLRDDSSESRASAQNTAPAPELPQGADWLRVESFAVKIPTGWVDLSPNAPPENFEGLAPAFVQRLKSQSGRAIAMDLAHGDDGFVENVALQAQACPAMELTEKTVQSEAFDRGFYAALLKYPNAKVKLLEKALVEIGGVPVVRVRQRIAIEGQPVVMNLGYLLPGAGGRCAMVYYSTTPNHFAKQRPIFEASAMQTRGLVKAASAGEGTAHLIGVIVGFVVGFAIVLVVLWSQLSGRRRASKVRPTRAL